MKDWTVENIQIFIRSFAIRKTYMTDFNVISKGNVEARSFEVVKFCFWL